MYFRKSAHKVHMRQETVKYKRMPMGVKCSPDIFQSKIFNLLGDIKGTKAYIDDILVVKRALSTST